MPYKVHASNPCWWLCRQLHTVGSGISFWLYKTSDRGAKCRARNIHKHRIVCVICWSSLEMLRKRHSWHLAVCAPQYLLLLPLISAHYNTAILTFCDWFWQVGMRPCGWNIPTVLLFHLPLPVQWVCLLLKAVSHYDAPAVISLLSTSYCNFPLIFKTLKELQYKIDLFSEVLYTVGRKLSL
jgi:hypothetical protein